MSKTKQLPLLLGSALDCENFAVLVLPTQMFILCLQVNLSSGEN